MSVENQLVVKLQARIDRAWNARVTAHTAGDKKSTRLHAAHAEEMAELIVAISDGSAEWLRKIPITS
jgi:hypothetical protein